jgi:hypothetical protein
VKELHTYICIASSDKKASEQVLAICFATIQMKKCIFCDHVCFYVGKLREKRIELILCMYVHMCIASWLGDVVKWYRLRGREIKSHQGIGRWLSFCTFFSAKVIFRGIFLGISWKNTFLKLFPRKIPIFPKNFLVENFPRNFQQK